MCNGPCSLDVLGCGCRFPGRPRTSHDAKGGVPSTDRDVVGEAPRAHGTSKGDWLLRCNLGRRPCAYGTPFGTLLRISTGGALPHPPPRLWVMRSRWKAETCVMLSCLRVFYGLFYQPSSRFCDRLIRVLVGPGDVRPVSDRMVSGNERRVGRAPRLCGVLHCSLPIAMRRGDGSGDPCCTGGPIGCSRRTPSCCLLSPSLLILVHG